MPRGPCLDPPETLHYVMVRGPERRVLFLDDRDRADLVGRLAAVVERTDVTVLAWTRLPNRFHLLGRSPPARPGPGVPSGLVTAMRSLLTGYAGAFNPPGGQAAHITTPLSCPEPVHGESWSRQGGNDRSGA